VDYGGTVWPWRNEGSQKDYQCRQKRRHNVRVAHQLPPRFFGTECSKQGEGGFENASSRKVLVRLIGILGTCAAG
jgi:hypothetical protein